MKSLYILGLACLIACGIQLASCDLGFSEVDVLVYKHEAPLTIVTYNADGHINSTTPFPDFMIGTQKVKAAVSPLTATIFLAFVDHTPNGLSVQVASLSYLSKRVINPLTTVNVSGFDDVVGIAHDTLSGVTVLSAYNGTSKINCFLEVSMHTGHVWKAICLPPFPSATFNGISVFTSSNTFGIISYGSPDPIVGLPYNDMICGVNIDDPTKPVPCEFIVQMGTGTFINLLPIYDSESLYIIGQNIKSTNDTQIWKSNPLEANAPFTKIGQFPSGANAHLPATAFAFYHPWREVVVALWAETSGLRLMAFDGKGAGTKMDRALDSLAEGFEAIAVGVRLADVSPPPVAPAPINVDAPFAVFNPAGQINPGGGTGAAVGIIIAVVIVLAAVAGFFLWRFYRNGGVKGTTGYENL